MAALEIVPCDEVPAISSSADNPPAVVDGAEVHGLLDAAQEAERLAATITDGDTREAVLKLARGLNSAAVILLTITSGVHRGRISLTNYPNPNPED